MRIVIFLLASMISACAYLKSESHIQNIVAAGWKDNGKVFTYSCENNVEISVLLNQSLAVKGSTYLLFGIAPIGKAKFADQQLNLSIVFNPKEKICKTEDTYLLVSNEKLKPYFLSLPLISLQKFSTAKRRKTDTFLYPDSNVKEQLKDRKSVV